MDKTTQGKVNTARKAFAKQYPHADVRPETCTFDRLCYSVATPFASALVAEIKFFGGKVTAQNFPGRTILDVR